MLNSSEVFDPTTGRWTLTAPMPSAYLYGTATALQDGTVLAVGGQTSDTVDSPSTAQAALFTPAAPPAHPMGLMWFNPASGQVASWLFNRFGTVVGSQTLSLHCGAATGCSDRWRADRAGRRQRRRSRRCDVGQPRQRAGGLLAAQRDRHGHRLPDISACTVGPPTAAPPPGYPSGWATSTATVTSI